MDCGVTCLPSVLIKFLFKKTISIFYILSMAAFAPIAELKSRDFMVELKIFVICSFTEKLANSWIEHGFFHKLN